MMKAIRIYVALVLLLLVVPMVALADCQCAQPNEEQMGFSAATCTEPAYYYLECRDCGGQWKVKGAPALGHNWKHVGGNDPTCIQDGYDEYQCINPGCTETKKETIPATGKHNWEYAMTNPALCESDGKEWYDCTYCGQSQYQTIPKLGHQWTVTETKAATCGEDGYTSYRCTRAGCGETKTETVKATGKHSWVLDYVNRDDVECVAGGVAYYYCSVCMDQKNESVAATGHKWEQVGTLTPTCVKNGAYYLECSKCGEQKTEVRPATGKHDYQHVGTLNPTCEKKGANYLECSVCGDQKTEERPATGHKWEDGQISKQPTCTEDGTVSSVCTVCGKTEKERVVPKLGHKWGTAKIVTKPTCTTAGKSESVCQTCGQKKTESIKQTAHSWGEWKVTKEATENETGTRERTCKSCGTKDTETIPKKGAKPTATPKPAATPKPTAKPASGSKATTAQQAEDGMIEVFTTAGKVNTRTGPGKDNKRVQQIAKKNTSLGELLEAQADSKGVVWYKVTYKKKTCWVTCEFARAVVGAPDGSIRPVEGEATELTRIYLKSIDEVRGLLQLEEDDRSELYDVEASTPDIYIGGNDYVEAIELTGEGYTVCGVKIGDKFSSAQKMFKKANLVLAEEGADTYVYHIICSPDSLSIDENGFDGVLTVVLDSDKQVASISMKANAPTEE